MSPKAEALETARMYAIVLGVLEDDAFELLHAASASSGVDDDFHLALSTHAVNLYRQRKRAQERVQELQRVVAGDK